MSKKNNPADYHPKSFYVTWEHAFDKFGFCDGDFSLTHYVEEQLCEKGYKVVSSQWGFHNEVISSIQKNGKEFMPCDNDKFMIGYSNPREYLADEIVEYLDKRFYDDYSFAQ